MLIHPHGGHVREEPFFLKEFLITTGLYDRVNFSPPEDYDACLLYVGPERATAAIYPWDKVPNEIRWAAPTPPRQRPTSPSDLRRELVDLMIRQGGILMAEEEGNAQKRSNIRDPDVFAILTDEAQDEETRRYKDQHDRLLYLRIERIKIEQHIARIRNLLA